MKIQELNFIQIKTKRSPTSNALETITKQKLKPYYNTVYQLLQLKHPQQKPYHKVCLQIEQKVQKIMPQIVLKRRIAQQTLDFKITKPLEKKHFSNQTFSSRIKKSKSVTKSFSLTKTEYAKHQRKDGFSDKFDTLRKLSKTFSESTLNQKKKYNLLQKWHKIVDNHYESLELEPRFISGQRNDQKLAFKQNQQRFKIEANNYKWVENTLISNDSEHVSLVRQEKSKYLRQKATQMYFYRGVNEKDVQECREIIEQDKELMDFSLNPTIETTNVPKVKTMFEFTRTKLHSLMSHYKSTRASSPTRPSPKKTRSLDRSIKKKMSATESQFKEYQKYKKAQDENPETYQIGDRYSNFRTKEDKFNMLGKMKEHQKSKYTTKVMDVNMHRKLFLKKK